MAVTDIVTIGTRSADESPDGDPGWRALDSLVEELEAARAHAVAVLGDVGDRNGCRAHGA